MNAVVRNRIAQLSRLGDEALECLRILALAGDEAGGPEACLEGLRRVAEDLGLLRPEVRP